MYPQHDAYTSLSSLHLHVCGFASVSCLILTTGHLKDPAGSPHHGQAQHCVVEVELIFGKSGFDPHRHPDRSPVSSWAQNDASSNIAEVQQYGFSHVCLATLLT